MSDQKYTFFWNGPFSQWFPSTFEIKGIRYNCAEQYMMAQKAELFGDKAALVQILATRSPRKQKAFGKSVKGFNQEEWNKVARQIVTDANYAKFSQNPDLKKLLFDTKGTTLVEASPYDKIWGIGISVLHKNINEPKKWPGLNWLGKVLTEVRDKLMEEEDAKTK